MSRYRSLLITTIVIGLIIAGRASILGAQVGKGSIVDLNTAAEENLRTLPHG